MGMVYRTLVRRPGGCRSVGLSRPTAYGNWLVYPNVAYLEMSEPLIFSKDLCKTFNGLKAVDGISLRMSRGECFGILGPNGAG